MSRVQPTTVAKRKTFPFNILQFNWIDPHFTVQDFSRIISFLLNIYHVYSCHFKFIVNDICNIITLPIMVQIFLNQDFINNFIFINLSFLSVLIFWTKYVLNCLKFAGIRVFLFLRFPGDAILTERFPVSQRYSQIKSVEIDNEINCNFPHFDLYDLP